MKSKVFFLVGLPIVFLLAFILYYILLCGNTELLIVNTAVAWFVEASVMLRVFSLIRQDKSKAGGTDSFGAINVSAIIIFVWTTIYSYFFYKEDTLIYLYAGIIFCLIILALFLFVFSYTSNKTETQNSQTEGIIQSKKAVIEKIDLRIKQIQSVLGKSADSEVWDLLVEIKTLKNRISVVPALKITATAPSLTKLDSLLDSIDGEITSKSRTSDKKSISLESIINEIKKIIINI
ncbi:MAG: hypothetical protein BGN96_11230 [Bacteroidales bacterium 45-6]|uniref:hypothetical protein n=1 Tax=uncultured Dysgonomonas sp. TaxID=206096 RepID=UPI00095ADA5F|nr:hypothetical protein [uncultured Dysgonomonas sp.]OJU49081.1 MAG: hypothetical protein BGN96_11230 [Bacteroidales bacterium 45-6]